MSSSAEQQRKRNAKPTIHIWRDGQRICFDVPHDGRLMTGTLFTSYVYAKDDDDQGYRVQRGWYPLFRMGNDTGNERDNFVYCYPGLLPVVSELLKQAGYDVDPATDVVPPIGDFVVPDPELSFLPHHDVLPFVQRNDRGLIKSHAHPAHLVMQIARAWPDKSLCVWVNTVSQADELFRHFRTHAFQATYASKQSRPERIGQILVATLPFLADHPVVQDRDIAIVLNSNSVFGKRGKDAIAFSFKARIYGFTDGSEQPPFIRDQVTALFGFERLVLNEDGRAIEPVNVVRVRFQGGVRLERDQNSAFMVKKRCIWHNKPRNEFIANLAEPLVQSDFRSVRLSQRLERRLQRRKRLRLGILVENVEHALALGAFLPDAAIAMGDEVQLDGLSRTAEDRYWVDEVANSPITIATLAGRHKLQRVDMLMRADGGCGSFISEDTNVGRKTPPLVIDIVDRQHPLLRRWSNDRKAAYEAEGWKLVSERPQTALESFMNTRPEVELP